MKRVCRESGVEFEISDDDLRRYEKLGVPPPSLCPEERARMRMSFANQRTLFHRVCAGSGKKIITNYPPEENVPVYDVEYWYSDKWDMYATGRPYDFRRSFFDQLAEILRVAPRPNLQRAPQFDENSDYTNYAGKNKNCYLIFDSDKNDSCLYSYSINSCTDVVDGFRCEACELCYECIDCSSCYGSTNLQDCFNCSSSHYLKSCIGCADCFGCVNLKNKRFCFFNEQLEEKDYRERLSHLGLGSRKARASFDAQFQEYARQFPHRFMQGVHNENVSGDYLTYSKDASHCFDSRKLWDCRFVSQAFDDAKDCFDCTEIGDGVELLYECCYTGYGGRLNRFTSHALGRTNELTYCYFTPFCSECFGCVGLHHAQHSILNRKYSKAEYDALLPRIIEHMRSTGEWGEFFPPRLSPMPYNLSHAHEYLPLTKEEALRRGFRWRDEDAREMQPASAPLPDTIAGAGDELLRETFACAETRKNYRLQKAELAFYRKLGVPPPDRCFDARHLRRLRRRNPRRLYQRTCAVSGVPLLSSFAPERPEQVVSDEVFAKLLE